MVFSLEDKHAIKFLRQTKGYGAKKLRTMFPAKCWSLEGLKSLIRKIDSMGDIRRRPGSGRPRSVRTANVVDEVEDLVLSQENAPGSHSTQRQTARQVGISVTSVNRIVNKDLRLKCHKKRRAHELSDANKKARLNCCRKLLRKYPVAMTNFIWFTDEKLFTVASPSNTQNDRVYAPEGVRKKSIEPQRLLRCRPTFSQSLMVSVGVSALGRTDLHFIDRGVKINGQHYRDVLLKQNLLPDIRQHSDYFTFQQDGAPAHRARETVELLRHETPDFIPPSLWPPNSPDLNPVDYKIWGLLQQRVYVKKVQNVEELRQRILDEWQRLDQRIIDSAVKQWRKRLRACVTAKGGHFEHTL